MNIWFNHWFSTAYHFMDMLKEKGYKIIASNRRDICVYKINADEFYLEPTNLSDTKYVDWCIDFCKEHKIDIFFPRHCMRAITARQEEFNDINVKVICEEEKKYFTILNSKKKTMDFFAENNICNVPEMEIVTTLEEFKKAYKSLRKKYEKICIKYDCDEGGTSYKLVDETYNVGLSEITASHSTWIKYDYLCKCLATKDKFRSLVVMPYLDGTEISIDCLGLGDKLLAIPRYKLSDRFTKFEMNEEIIKIAEKFYECMPLTAPFNLQLRYDKDTLYVLEVNTRMAGGSWKTKFMGCEFPVLAVEKKIGKLKELPTPNKKEMIVGNLEEAIVYDAK